MLEQALKYAGQYSIIPVNGKTKKPYIKWFKYKKEKATVEQVREWFEKWPDAGIGLMTGKINDLLVLDVDPRNGGSNEPLKHFDTPTSKTGGGGWHYFFKYPDYDVPTLPEIVKGIDLKSDGGYVIIPPSSHSSGNKYEWIKSFEDVSLTPLPKGMKQLIEKKSFQKVGEYLNGVSKGKRDESGTVVCGKIINNLPEADIDTVGWKLFVEWNKKNDPPMSERQLAKIFRSIRKRELSKRTHSSEGQNPNTMYISRVPQIFEPKRPILISELSPNFVPQMYLWEGYLYKGSVTLLSALWKAGKSTLLGYLLEAFENEKKFVGQRINKARTLVVSEENQGAWIRRKDRHGLTNVYVDCKPIRGKLNSQEWCSYIEYITNFCKEEDIDLVVFDTLSTFWNVRDENDSARVTEALLPINMLTDAGLSVLLIHHLRKSGGSEGTRTRGSGALGAYVDILLEFTRVNEDEPTDCQRKLKGWSRYEETPLELTLEMWGDKYRAIGAPHEAKKGNTKNILLSNIFYDKPKTVRRLHEEWDVEANGNLSKKTIRRYIKQLLKEGKIEEGSPIQKGSNTTSTYIKLRDKTRGTQKITTIKNEPKSEGQVSIPQDEVAVVPQVKSYPGKEKNY